MEHSGLSAITADIKPKSTWALVLAADYDHESNPCFNQVESYRFVRILGRLVTNRAQEITQILSQFERIIMVGVNSIQPRDLSTVIWNDFTWLFWFQPRVIPTTILVKRIGRFGWFGRFSRSINLYQSFNYGFNRYFEMVNLVLVTNSDHHWSQRIDQTIRKVLN